MTRHNRWGARSAALAALAAVFNGALLGAPIAGAALWQEITRSGAYDFHVTPAAQEDVRHRLGLRLAALADPSERPADGWATLISRELVAGDVLAARGFALAALEALPPPQASRLAASLPASYDDDALAAAAALRLPDDIRAHFESQTAGYGGAGAVRLALGEAQDLTSQAAAMARGEPADPVAFSALAVAMLSPGAFPDETAAGAALARAARRAGALSPDFTRRLLALSAQALPPDRLAAALAAGAGDGIDPDGATLQAIAAAMDAEAAARFASVLADLGRVSQAAGAATAIRVLPLVAHEQHLPQARLLAAGGAERAAAAAKYIDDPDALLGLAQRTLAATPTIRDFASRLVAAFAAAGIALIATLWLLAPARPRKRARRRATARRAAMAETIDEDAFEFEGARALDRVD